MLLRAQKHRSCANFMAATENRDDACVQINCHHKLAGRDTFIIPEPLAIFDRAIDIENALDNEIVLAGLFLLGGRRFGRWWLGSGLGLLITRCNRAHSRARLSGSSGRCILRYSERGIGCHFERGIGRGFKRRIDDLNRRIIDNRLVPCFQRIGINRNRDRVSRVVREPFCAHHRGSSQQGQTARSDNFEHFWYNHSAMQYGLFWSNSLAPTARRAVWRR